jgi:hypothetical protein
MNPSEEVVEMAELHLPFGEYCFAYINEDLTIQVSTRGVEPIDLVSAFVSYMKAVGFAPEAIESALHTQATVMKSFRVPGSIFKPEE